MLKALRQGPRLVRVKPADSEEWLAMWGDVDLQVLAASSAGLPYKVVSTPWFAHPVTKMWIGHERALVAYGIEVCRAWKKRGYKDTCEEKIGAFVREFPPESAAYPDWLTDEFCDSHKAILYRKDPTFYHAFRGYADGRA